MDRLSFTPDDGYSEPGFVGATEGFHGELRFEFRPMLVEEQSLLVAAAQALKPAAYDRQCAAVICEKLIAWDLCDAAGEIVPIQARTLLRLKPRLFARLLGIVMGVEASDRDPRWSEATKEELAADQYESALSGQSIRALREERDEKNCAAG